MFVLLLWLVCLCFDCFYNDTATTDIYTGEDTLSLHDALPISFFEERDLLQYCSCGYGHSFGILSHYYGREAGLELREDIDTVLEAGMVISMEPMLTIPEGQAGAGGYREHDILVVGEDGADNITKYPYGPDFNVVG